MAPLISQRTVLPSIPRPLGPAIRRRLHLQESSGKVSLPLLVASRSAPVLVQSRGSPIASEPPWRSVHVHDHVIEHHHFHIYSGDLPAAQQKRTPAVLSEVKVAAPQQPVLMRHQSEPVFKDATTRLLEAAQAVQHRHAARWASMGDMDAGARSSSSDSAVNPEIQESCQVSRSPSETFSLGLFSSGAIVPDRELSPAEIAARRAGAMNAAMSLVNAQDDSESFASEPRGRVLLLKNSEAAQQLRRELIEKAGSVREAFKFFDHHHNGLICLAEFLAGLQTLQIDVHQIPGAPEPTNLFHEKSEMQHAEHDDGLIDIYQLLGISREARRIEHMPTMELWHQHESNIHSSKNKLERRAKWTDEDRPDGEAQLLRLQAQTKKKNATQMIKRDWKATRPQKALRGTQHLLHDPRLHRKCAREAVHTPEEEDVLQEKAETRNRVNHIKQAMRSCAESRHQVVHMQHLLQPSPAEDALRSLSGAIHHSLRKTEAIQDPQPTPAPVNLE